MQNSETEPRTDMAAAQKLRGRPRAFDRDAALAQAMRLFWGKGYEATSISDLTEAMGIGSPSLYAAFGSKEALYAEAVRYYVDTNEAHAWGPFYAARTARDAIAAYLLALAGALTGCDLPNGCMVTLSTVGSEGHPELGAMVRDERAVAFNRLMARLETAVTEGELPATTDIRALARFVHTIVSGMSVLARDGASRQDLEAVARIALNGLDVAGGG